jgi:copper chaperone CopZ
MNDEQTTILNVTGMTCGACVRHVGAALRSLDGVRDATVALREGEARVARDVRRVSVEDLIAAIRRAGYGASLSDRAERASVEAPGT